MQRTPTVRILTLAAASVLLGGCGLFGGDDGAPEPVAVATEATTATAQPGDDGLELVTARLQAQAGEDAEPVPVDEALPVVATRTGTSAAETFELDLNGVLVQGDLMTVVFTIRSTAGGLLSISSLFDDGIDQAHPGSDGPGSSPNAWSTDGVYVLDPVNARRHLAAYDATGRCVCSSALNTSGLAVGTQLVLATTFAAPPEDVDSVEVGIPAAGVFSAVPVTR